MHTIPGADDKPLKPTRANQALSPVVTTQEAFTAPPFTAQSHFHNERAVLLCGDVREQLRHIVNSNVKVDCIVTSPPFYGQRDYGVDGQIGLEEHPQQFLNNLVETFNLCWDVLSDTGSLWVNLGDTYWNGKGTTKRIDEKQSARSFGRRPQDGPGDGKWARPKQLLLLPHRFAIAMQEQGWLVRNDNVWVKPNPTPDPVRDRCSASHEYVFHFTKERWYYFNQVQVCRTAATGSKMPPLDTWTFQQVRGSKPHKASFHEELVRIPVLATTPPDGIVLDPFNGSGTTTAFAVRCGFRSIGIDLNKDYCDYAAESLQQPII